MFYSQVLFCVSHWSLAKANVVGGLKGFTDYIIFLRYVESA